MKLTRLAAPLLAVAMLGTTGIVAAAQYGPPPGARGGWDAPPSQYRDIQRRGFQDGIDGARKDIENHRRPDVNNRDEYRRPNVSPRDRRNYRDAFRQGYNTAMRHMLHGRR